MFVWTEIDVVSGGTLEEVFEFELEIVLGILVVFTNGVTAEVNVGWFIRLSVALLDITNFIAFCTSSCHHGQSLDDAECSPLQFVQCGDLVHASFV